MNQPATPPKYLTLYDRTDRIKTIQIPKSVNIVYCATGAAKQEPEAIQMLAQMLLVTGVEELNFFILPQVTKSFMSTYRDLVTKYRPYVKLNLINLAALTASKNPTFISSASRDNIFDSNLKLAIVYDLRTSAFYKGPLKATTVLNFEFGECVPKIVEKVGNTKLFQDTMFHLAMNSLVKNNIPDGILSAHDFMDSMGETIAIERGILKNAVK